MDTQRLSQTVQALLDWYRGHARVLPWRADREPYHVWLSEIMLQQTRVEAVRGYYARFLAAAPDVFALAALPEAQLLKLWEGLGYYNRARKAQECAREIAARGGVWPDTVEGLLALPGIGPYTAGAIASICFERPAAAVDGNVLRVCARVLDERQAGAYASGQGLGDVRLRSARDGRHIFTHIVWTMRCYTLECSAMPPRYHWATPEELREEISLPTAFRQFVDAE